MKTSRPKKRAPARRGAAASRKPKGRRTASAPGASGARRTAPRRADFGAPVDEFFARQPPPIREVLEALRALVLEAAPKATSSIKWGMPFFALDGEMLCALAGFKAHANLILPGPPGTYDDPGGRLEGEGKTGKHLKLRSLGDLPRAEVRGWLRTAAARARGGSR